jgi:hypothetical protein
MRTIVEMLPNGLMQQKVEVSEDEQRMWDAMWASQFREAAIRQAARGRHAVQRDPISP